MRKKCIAIFAEKLYGGGVEKILQIVCHNFDYNKYNVTLYSSRQEEMPNGTYPYEITHRYIFNECSGDFLSVFYGKVMTKFKLFVYYHCSPRTYYRIFIRKRYDVGVAFIEGYATRILSGAPKGMKKIAWVHTDMMNNHWSKVAFQNVYEEQTCYQNINKVICVSKVVERSVKNLFDINNTKVLLNPMDVKRVKYLATLFEVHYSSSKYNLITLGSLISVKGYERLLACILKLSQEGFDFRLRILGEGVKHSNLENFIEENKLGNSVELLGYKDNPYPFLKASDIYVCSSYAEGYNTAVSEAIILGKAIVSTEVSGIHEQLGENSEYGIITENSEEGLYFGLKKMLSDDNVRYYQRKSKNRQHLFNLNARMEEIYNLIEQ